MDDSSSSSDSEPAAPRRREGNRHMTAESEAYMPVRGRGGGRDGGRGGGGRGGGRGRGGRGGSRRSVARPRPNLPNDLNAPKQQIRYHKNLLKCMEYTHKRVYASDTVFEKEAVLALTPEDIYKWMCKAVYGTEDPSNDMVPTKRSTTLEYWKKSVSHFMGTTSKWHEATKTGNATQSKRVNNLIKAVKRAETIETRGTGQVEPTEDRDVLLSRTRESAQWRAAVYARLGTTSKMVAEVQKLELENFTEIQRTLRRMERLLKDIVRSPARPISGVNRTDRGTPIRVGAAAQGQDIRPATLCRNPKTLSILWEEYLNGIGGRLPAQQFTREQRGVLSVRANYCNRKGFWDCMQRLIDKGYTEQAALARISRVYEGCITQKLKAIRKDERNGGHPQCEPNRTRRRRR